MYNAAISFVRRLSGAADNDQHEPEDFSNHHNAETTRDDDDEEYDEEDDDDEQMPERRVGLVDYDSDEAEDDDDSEEAEDDDDNGERNDGEHDDGADEEEMGGPSVDDLFGPGELERRMAEEAAGIDPYAEEFAGIDPYIDEFAEARTEVDDDDLAARNADFDDEVPEISEEERAVTEAIYAEIRRKVAEDEAARAAAYDTPYVASPSSSSSSAGSESTSTGSDFMGSCAEPASAAREFRTPPPEDLDEPTTPVLNALPLTREELVVPTADMVASLAGAPRGLILRTMLGHGHRTVIRPSRHGPPTPYTSPRTSPAPDLGIDEAHNTNAPAPPTAAPRNALKRTMNADYFLADGIGGYFSTRAQHQVSRPWEPSYEETMRLNERRRAEAAAAAAAALSVQQQQQPAPPVRSPSVESDDVDMAGIDNAEEDDGDCSPSPDEGMSSQIQQAVEPPVHIATPPASPSPSHRQKRARSEEDTADDGAHVEKRRRVETETQPGSPAAERVRAGMRTRAQAGTSTVATRSTIPISTTTTVAPAPPSAGMDVVENDVDVDNASDEMHVESLIAQPVAGPSTRPATTSPAATPKRQPRRRGRAVQKTPTSPRRSTRIRENAARRAKVAEGARAAAAAAPKTIARRGKRSGNGRA